MSLNNVSNGFHNASMYYFSGVPWVTSSTVDGPKVHHFQCVTKDFTLNNVGTANIFVGYTANAFISSHFITVPPSGSYTAEYRIADLYLSSSAAVAYNLSAGLTLIDRKEMPTLTGTLSTGAPGWDGVG